MQKRIEQLGVRIQNSAKVQEGDQPAEDPEELIHMLGTNLEELEALVIRINRTNQATLLEEGKTITAKIAHRDILTKKATILSAIHKELTDRRTRFTRQEIKYENVMSAYELSKRMDECSRQLRETDMEIQAANWSVDLIE